MSNSFCSDSPDHKHHYTEDNFEFCDFYCMYCYKSLDYQEGAEEFMEDSTSDILESKSEEFWNSLTKEQQLDVFCAVCRRIYQSEIIDKGSYRYTLYDVFKFGPESYSPALDAGYLTIHNRIYTDDDINDFITKIKKFGEENNISEEKISNLITTLYLY
jgi:hypothetical protein